MNKQELVNTDYVRNATYLGKFILQENKYKCRCKKCNCIVEVGTFVLWLPTVGVKCATDCTPLEML